MGIPAVQRHWLVQLVLKHVQVVQPVWLRLYLAAPRRLETEVSGMLRDAINALHLRERRVEANGGGAERFRVLMRFKRLLPHTVRVFLALYLFTVVLKVKQAATAAAVAAVAEAGVQTYRGSVPA